MQDSDKNSTKIKKKIFSRNFFIIILIIIVIIILIIAIFQSLYLTIIFWTDVTFKNETQENIKITPVGMSRIQERNKIGPIVTIQAPLFFLKAQDTRFNLADNKSLKITYDYTDTNLQLLIVEYLNDDIKILKLDPEFCKNASSYGYCWAKRKSNYNIPPRSELPACPDILKPTINGEYIEIDDNLIEILESL